MPMAVLSTYMEDTFVLGSSMDKEAPV